MEENNNFCLRKYMQHNLFMISAFLNEAKYNLIQIEPSQCCAFVSDNWGVYRKGCLVL